MQLPSNKVFLAVTFTSKTCTIKGKNVNSSRRDLNTQDVVDDFLTARNENAFVVKLTGSVVSIFDWPGGRNLGNLIKETVNLGVRVYHKLVKLKKKRKKAMPNVT